MLRIAFNIKFNADTVAEALVKADELVAEFLDIPTTQVADRVNSELRVELAEAKDGVAPSARFVITVIGNLKNGFVFTPAV
jgi:hypothetical protein